MDGPRLSSSRFLIQPFSSLQSTGPVKKLVSPLGGKVIKSNKDIIKAIAKGEGSCDDGDGFYPIICDPGTPTYDSCSRVGLISCDKDSGDCPAFFQADADAKDDKVSGGVVFFIAIIILFICLICLVTVLQKMLLGMSTRIIYKATDLNGYVAMLIGTGITILVQSSSITTSTLTPFVGMGALRLEQMLPLTLGANIGTFGFFPLEIRSLTKYRYHNDCDHGCHGDGWNQVSPSCPCSLVFQPHRYRHLVSHPLYA